MNETVAHGLLPGLQSLRFGAEHIAAPRRREYRCASDLESIAALRSGKHRLTPVQRALQRHSLKQSLQWIDSGASFLLTIFI